MLCDGFPTAPKESNLTVVKKIFRYLAGTKDIGLWYPMDEDFNFIDYSNTDYARYKEYRKACQVIANFLDAP